MNRKILILGSEGYLGCTLIPLLIKKYKAKNLLELITVILVKIIFIKTLKS